MPEIVSSMTVDGLLGSEVHGFKGYNRWTLLSILLKIRNTRHHPSGETHL